jgi:16S rRNA (cytidine1402-2'-O)-methyltransferase
LPSNKFVFEGFLPVKKGRQTRLKELAEESRTIIFYESPHKLLKTLADFQTHYGAERQISISREITKMFEEHYRGTVTEAMAYFTEKKPKGEFVLVLAGAETK